MSDGNIEIPASIVAYVADRDAKRAEGVARTLGALTPRERALVKEAAVMGYVQGVRAADAIHKVEIPPDSHILHLVVAECHGMPDLYPNISAHGDWRG